MAVIGMTLEAITQELSKLNPEELDYVRSYLSALSLENNPELRDEYARMLDDQTPGAWIPMEEAVKRLGFTMDEVSSVE